MSNPSPTESVRRALARLRAIDDPAIIFISVRTEAELLAEAARLELAPDGKPLFGLTIAVKDNIDVAGLPTTAACPAFAYTPSRSAHVVERLVAAGAIVVGKPIWTSSRRDSGGALALRRAAQYLERRSDPEGPVPALAVAVAAGIVDASLGTDTSRFRSHSGRHERHRRLEAFARAVVVVGHGAGVPDT